jgi:NAD(P)-dependent dehydrogenase (short-subunit alcohol dehydrogenase family)
MARGTQGLQAAAAEVEKRGGKALAVPLDVADPDAIEAAADNVENQFGPIDIWVNCAMATIFAPFHRISPEEYRRATEVTYLGFSLWHDGRLEANAAAQPRHDRPGRLCLGLSGDTAAVGLLRCQIRDPWLYRQPADGIDA